MTPPQVDRIWLLTWTTYGSWLPGDRRGFVSPVRDDSGELVLHNLPGTPVDADDPELYEAVREQMRGPPIYLIALQAESVVDTCRLNADFRTHRLFAIAAMANHVHLLLGVTGDPEPEELLGDFKAYASRYLNRSWPRPINGTWWTRSGSKRKLPNGDEAALIAAARYVRNQYRPLAWWLEPGLE